MHFHIQPHACQSSTHVCLLYKAGPGVDLANTQTFYVCLFGTFPLTVHVASDGQRGPVLEQDGLHRLHSRHRHSLPLGLEVGIVPGAVEHGHEPRSHRPIGRVQILQQRSTREAAQIEFWRRQPLQEEGARGGRLEVDLKSEVGGRAMGGVGA